MEVVKKQNPIFFGKLFLEVKLSMWNVTVVGIQDIDLDR